jgi:phosphoribosyl 1,2-cyclic phosphodiesterase
VRVRVWGCRGTIAAPGAETARYGGNTSCVEVRLDDGSVIILDAGTGIRVLGNALAAESVPRIDLLLTHLHVDHVEGLGVFEPIWTAGTELHVWGPASPVAGLAERLATYFSPPLFPVHLGEVPAKTVFHDTPDGEWTIGSARVASHPIMHPGPTVGYRIEADGSSLAYLTDHEPALGGNLDAPLDWISGTAIALGADLLIHDCQYTEEEYATRIGFGHSTTDQLARFAELTGVDRVVMYHHDPMHGDDVLDAMHERVIERWGVGRERVAIAAEGLTLDV